MAKIDMVMPQMGESIAEGTILKWLKNVGDKIERDETILEISTDKVDSEIPAPATGVLAKILVEEGKTVGVGTPIAVIETDAAAAAGGNGKAEQAAAPAAAAPAPAMTAEAPAPAPAAGGEVVRAGTRFYSPLVREIAKQENISMAELEAIPGSGEGGRVTKKDILAYVEQRKAKPAATAPAPAVAPAKPAAPVAAPAPAAPRPAPAPAPAVTPYDQDRVEVVPMDNMRRRIAEHMVMSKQTSPHVYSVSVCDLTKIVKYRERVKNEFEQREGTKLTYTPFFLEACVRAIREFPLINASLDGSNIIMKKAINLGVAVALDNGLIVPVIKNADALNLVGLARATNDLANRARNKQLKPDEVQGGTFSITNMGSFGNLFGIPVINQPQVAILGIGAIRKTPVVVGEGIAIRDIVYLSLSYDHRLIDGAYGGQFLQRIVEHLESFDLPQ
ncbi:2-oxo acid dehydrogenase subunit E2 [candidate division KSB1 bacterium]|nr:2-oxo acid dehydrogenase subunit E2 [bacterium]NUM66760.1 2-oxo acid dehydrogenase subunit E2 [candidate division KSB1 bacterium]